MKRCTHVALVMSFLVLTLATSGLAQVTGLADTSKEGSLLIWPKIQTSDRYETFVIITNSSPNPVDVKCFYEIKDVESNPASQCLLAQFDLHLYGHNPLVFRASDGSTLDGRPVAGGIGVGEVGALKCWAIDITERRQISWNHLSGFAVIEERLSWEYTSKKYGTVKVPGDAVSAWQYSAWRFAANVIDSSGKFADGFWVGQVADIDGATSNSMNLKASPTTVVDPDNCPGPDYSAASCSLPNAAYDACPKYLTFDFLAEPSGSTKADGFALNDLALVPCKADLSDTPADLKTRVKYTIWNENEVKFVALTQCTDCSFHTGLGSLAVPRNQKLFQLQFLRTSSGRFRVEAVASSKCGADSVSTPLIGVLSSKLVTTTDMVGTNGSTNGKETSDFGYIKWAPTGEYYQKPRR
jgi:hypothetical protein